MDRLHHKPAVRLQVLSSASISHLESLNYVYALNDVGIVDGVRLPTRTSHLLTVPAQQHAIRGSGCGRGGSSRQQPLLPLEPNLVLSDAFFTKSVEHVPRGWIALLGLLPQGRCLVGVDLPGFLVTFMRRIPQLFKGVLATYASQRLGGRHTNSLVGIAQAVGKRFYRLRLGSLHLAQLLRGSPSNRWIVRLEVYHMP